jgi:Zn-dependent protease with chaperone function
MAGDFQLERGASFGEWIHEQMHEAVAFETEAWALDRIRRVEQKLQEGRPEAERLLVEIPWMEHVNAFTCPGRYIYISRRLFERCATDAEVAMIVAHEMAHHDLDHVNLFAGWAPKVLALPGAALFAFAFHSLERLLYGPRIESDADRHGLDHCVAAGYDARECVKFFDILEQHALNMGDLDIVYGPDENADNHSDDNASWTSKSLIWAWQHIRGYPSIHDRRQMLLKFIPSMPLPQSRE